MSTEIGTVTIENARIIFRNFSGKETQFNREGDRNFSVILPPDVAEQMASDGWNVKQLPVREEGEEPTLVLPVAVSYKVRPPRIVTITSRARTNLGEADIDILDWSSIQSADLIVRPYEWTVNGKSGVKAYLQSLFVVLEEDELERKWAINEAEHN